MRRCGYCHRGGHNRATCPKLKDYIRANPDCYTARQEKRKKAHKAERKALSVRLGSKRVCGYCKNSGHNKRTCPKIASDRWDTTVANKTFRKKFMALCKKVGLAPGALMELKINENQSHWAIEALQNQIKRNGSLAMVVSFAHEKINAHLGDEHHYLSGPQQAVIRIRYPNNRKEVIKLPIGFEGLATEHCSKNWHVGCPADIETLEILFTQEWKSGRDGVDKMLGLDS